MKNLLWLRLTVAMLVGGSTLIWSEQQSETNPIAPSSSRLQINPSASGPNFEIPFVVPLPAHAARPPAPPNTPRFQVNAPRVASPVPPPEPPAAAEYFLPDRDAKPPISPENANLNLPADLEITTTDTGEKIILPAGTYRQILQLPIDSPLMRTTDQVRRDQARPVEVKKETSRYAEPEKKSVWVRYESLEKIKIGEAERRGGLDIPAHGPTGLGPRLWYAKSETADTASSVFYFIFGGLGYGVANLAGWSGGNTREIPGDFEYRLIRR
jgi:hypothetical protein